MNLKMHHHKSTTFNNPPAHVNAVVNPLSTWHKWYKHVFSKSGKTTQSLPPLCKTPFCKWQSPRSKDNIAPESSPLDWTKRRHQPPNTPFSLHFHKSRVDINHRTGFLCSLWLWVCEVRESLWSFGVQDNRHQNRPTTTTGFNSQTLA